MDVVAKAIDNAAEYDMRLARKQGSILIAGTKVGNVELSYNPETREYHASYQGVTRTAYAAEMKDFLKTLYVVEIE